MTKYEKYAFEKYTRDLPCIKLETSCSKKSDTALIRYKVDRMLLQLYCYIISVSDLFEQRVTNF